MQSSQALSDHQSVWILPSLKQVADQVKDVVFVVFTKRSCPCPPWISEGDVTSHATVLRHVGRSPGHNTLSICSTNITVNRELKQLTPDADHYLASFGKRMEDTGFIGRHQREAALRLLHIHRLRSYLVFMSVSRLASKVRNQWLIDQSMPRTTPKDPRNRALPISPTRPTRPQSEFRQGIGE